MGRYVRQFEISITFDGEPVTATLRHATQQEILTLETGDKKELLMGFSRRLNDAIVDLRGPVDAAGVQVPKEEFLNVAYFSKAVMQIGTQWINRATPSNPPSPDA